MNVKNVNILFIYSFIHHIDREMTNVVNNNSLELLPVVPLSISLARELTERGRQKAHIQLPVHTIQLRIHRRE